MPNICEARQRSQTRTFASFAARMHFFVRSLARPLSRSELRPIRAESGRRAELDGPQIALFAVLACFASAIANFAALLGGGFARPSRGHRRRQSRTGQRPDWVGREVHFCGAKLANLAKLAKPRVGPHGGSSTRLRTICKVDAACRSTNHPTQPSTPPPCACATCTMQHAFDQLSNIPFFLNSSRQQLIYPHRIVTRRLNWRPAR